MKMLIIDNHDSFVYNIKQFYDSLRIKTTLVSNDLVTRSEITRSDTIVISPGPGNPMQLEDRGNVGDFPEILEKKVLGICFGHQLLGMYLGTRVRRGNKIMHGEIDSIRHFVNPLYSGVPFEFKAVRYHSLVIDPNEEIIVDAISTTDREVMGFHSAHGQIFGLQFHPESFYTRHGRRIMENFVRTRSK